MQKLENLANMLDRAECPEEAEFVRDLWQQRADLLEALKDAKYKLEWFVESYPHDVAQPQAKFFSIIDSAITKAEAAE